MFNPVSVGKRTRYSYAKIKEVMEMPHLLDIQRNSYNWFTKDGLKELLKDISPISDFKKCLSTVLPNEPVPPVMSRVAPLNVDMIVSPI